MQQHTAAGAETSVRPILIVSPHYDDAVFSCGDLLAARPGSTVLTVYAGMPPQSGCSTDWDRRCGFSSAYEAMGARGDENRRALAALEAHAMDLDFLDDQYVTQPPVDMARLGESVSRVVSELRPASIFAPLGLFHRDHIRCSDALMALYPAWRAIEWFLYEDIPYRRYEGLVQERLSALLARGLIATPAGIRCAAGCKAIAVATYRSQLAGLGPDSGRRIVQEPERYWRLGARAQ